MGAILTLLRLLIAVIIAGVSGFAVGEFASLYGHVQPIAAKMFGIAVSAALALVLIAVLGRQAKRWH